MKLSIEHATSLVTAFEPGDDAKADTSRTQTLALLADTAAPADRAQFLPGHLTGSAIILAPDRRRVLLVLHERLRRWLQPGGHVEPDDATILDTALREVAEETNAELDTSREPRLVGVDVHAIPAARGEPDHLHHDLLFGFLARSDRHRVSAESRAVRWVDLDELDALDLDDPLLRNIERASSCYR